MKEFPLGPNQLQPQFHLLGGFAVIGLGQLLQPALARAQLLHHVVGQIAAAMNSPGASARGRAPLARGVLGRLFRARVLPPPCARPSARMTGGSSSPNLTSVDDDDAEGDEQDEIAIGKRRAIGQRERMASAAASETTPRMPVKEQRTPLPGRRGSRRASEGMSQRQIHGG